jgi:2-polyprenyl-3-methyl-5-hydroxy-6-metoxy-1,4-benzoquinol methylase
MGYDDRYDPDTDFDRWYTRGTGAAIAGFLHAGDEVLELGCATGAMTADFVARGATVVAIDRSEPWLDRARARGLAGADFQAGDIDELELGRTFDHVVAANVLHEVLDVAGVLARCRRHLRDEGLLHVTLPNPRSLHHLLGRAMGLRPALDEPSERARGLETLRVVDVDELTAAAAVAGFAPVHRGGVMVKPLPNDRMAALPDAILEGFLALAPELPEHCAMNHVVLRAA